MSYSTLSHSVSRPAAVQPQQSPSNTASSASSSYSRDPLLPYNQELRAQFLCLQAEAEVLLQQVQAQLPSH